MSTIKLNTDCICLGHLASNARLLQENSQSEHAYYCSDIINTVESVHVLYMYYVAYDWSNNGNFVFFFTLGLKSIPSFCFFCSLEAWNIQ